VSAGGAGLPAARLAARRSRRGAATVDATVASLATGGSAIAGCSAAGRAADAGRATGAGVPAPERACSIAATRSLLRSFAVGMPMLPASS
jgi:hypothetical protein